MTVDLEKRKAIGKAAGLSESWADRLVGETEEELRSDAQRLVAMVEEWRAAQPLTMDNIRGWTQDQFIERWDEAEKVLATPTKPRGPLPGPGLLTMEHVKTMTQKEFLERMDEVDKLMWGG